MSVPNTETFSLTDVVSEIGGGQTSLQACFDDAIAGGFDPTYDNNGYAPANSHLPHDPRTRRTRHQQQKPLPHPRPAKTSPAPPPGPGKMPPPHRHRNPRLPQNHRNRP